jgi:hypothetical protein
LLLRLCIAIELLLAAGTVAAQPGQVRVSGRVFDMSQSIPLQSVSVLSTLGTGTVTDSMGRYTIYVRETDSIWFSYLDKPTPKYPVRTITNIQNFEVSLHVNVTELRQVMVKPRNYKQDSIQNRIDYAKAFNFQKPGIGVSVTPGGAAGLDLDEFIHMFQFRRNKRMVAFRERLVREEQERFIDHRFNRGLVIRITQLRGDDLDTFMIQYKPDLFFTQTATDYEFQLYIKLSSEKYQRLKKAMSDLRKEGVE